MSSPCTAVVVPPTVAGLDGRCSSGLFGVRRSGPRARGATIRQRSQPAERSSSTASTCDPGTWTTTSPGVLKPPVPSSTSQRDPAVGARAPPTPTAGRSGRCRGPPASHSTWIATAQFGTGAIEPDVAACRRPAASPRTRRPAARWPARSTGRTAGRRRPPVITYVRRQCEDVRGRRSCGTRSPRSSAGAASRPRCRPRRHGPPRAAAVSQNVTGTLAAVCGKHPQADQVEELHVEPVGHPVEPVEHRVGEVGEGLEDGHAGIGHVVVGPLGTATHDQSFGVVDQVLEAAVVEAGCGRRHRLTPRRGSRRTGRRGCAGRSCRGSHR